VLKATSLEKLPYGGMELIDNHVETNLKEKLKSVRSLFSIEHNRLIQRLQGNKIKNWEDLQHMLTASMQNFLSLIVRSLQFHAIIAGINYRSRKHAKTIFHHPDQGD
jgi:hypothetical protein